MTGGSGGMLSSEVSSQWDQIAIPSTISCTTAVISHLVPTETSRVQLLSVFSILSVKLSSVQTSVKLVGARLQPVPRSSRCFASSLQSDSGSVYTDLL